MVVWDGQYILETGMLMLQFKGSVAYRSLLALSYLVNSHSPGNASFMNEIKNATTRCY